MATPTCLPDPALACPSPHQLQKDKGRGARLLPGQKNNHQLTPGLASKLLTPSPGAQLQDTVKSEFHKNSILASGTFPP